MYIKCICIDGIMYYKGGNNLCVNHCKSTAENSYQSFWPWILLWKCMRWVKVSLMGLNLTSSPSPSWPTSDLTYIILPWEQAWSICEQRVIHCCWYSCVWAATLCCNIIFQRGIKTRMGFVLSAWCHDNLRGAFDRGTRDDTSVTFLFLR